ncbi:MAG: ComEC/Rec2 family competence protein, partial [Proteobacteria bacterium]|nr:ComEC/Rec2 family competence protein [Pseudomonadota bacterium]
HRVSFQLSFAAMAGIALTQPFIPRWTPATAGPGHTWWEPWAFYLVRAPLMMLIISWSAMLATWPLLAFNFRKVALSDCRFIFVPDLSASRVQTCLADYRSEGLSITSSNHHLQAIKAFCRWMVLDGRAAESPLRQLVTTTLFYKFFTRWSRPWDYRPCPRTTGR